MNIEELREHCLSLKGVTEGFPFGESTLVFKVMGKVFCLAGIDNHPVSCNVKCDPETAIELREMYTGVVPGYHMNKQHWNTIVFDGSFEDGLGRQWIRDSYDLIVSSLSTKLKQELAQLP